MSVVAGGLPTKEKGAPSIARSKWQLRDVQLGERQSGCFFFSSRRRHTRYWRDWSSDVCSSDLMDHHLIEVFSRMVKDYGCSVDDVLETPELRAVYLADARRDLGQIGRVSCRERV